MDHFIAIHGYRCRIIRRYKVTAPAGKMKFITGDRFQAQDGSAVHSHHPGVIGIVHFHRSGPFNLDGEGILFYKNSLQAAIGGCHKTVFSIC